MRVRERMCVCLCARVGACVCVCVCVCVYYTDCPLNIPIAGLRTNILDSFYELKQQRYTHNRPSPRSVDVGQTQTIRASTRLTD